MPEYSHPGKILLADDDELFRSGLAARLSRAGFDCVCAANAAEATHLLRTTEFDVLVSDIYMPGNVGLELIQEVPQITAGLPVILLTGRPTVETAVQSVNLSVAGYLPKPPDWEALLAVLLKAIATSRCCRNVMGSRRRLEQWTRDLDRIEKNLRESNSASKAAPIGQYLQILAAQFQSSLRELEQSLTLLTQARPSEAGRPEPDLLAAVERTVEVLEQTKQNFKSKRLGDLRTELEALLQRRGPRNS